MQMLRSVPFNLFAVAVTLATIAGAVSADTAYWEKKLPKDDSAVGEYTFVVYQFSRKGRTLENNKKYDWVSTFSRSTAITTAVDWEKAGMGVHVLWSKGKNLTNDDIEKWVAKSYQETYGKVAPRPADNSPSLAGTVWVDKNGDYYWFYADGKVERGDSSPGITSNDRGTWKRADNKVTITLRGASGTWTLDGTKMTYGLRTLTQTK
jgi:hypothetical protein